MIRALIVLFAIIPVPLTSGIDYGLAYFDVSLSNGILTLKLVDLSPYERTFSININGTLYEVASNGSVSIEVPSEFELHVTGCAKGSDYPRLEANIYVREPANFALVNEVTLVRSSGLYVSRVPHAYAEEPREASARIAVKNEATGDSIEGTGISHEFVLAAGDNPFDSHVTLDVSNGENASASLDIAFKFFINSDSPGLDVEYSATGHTVSLNVTVNTPAKKALLEVYVDDDKVLETVVDSGQTVSISRALEYGEHEILIKARDPSGSAERSIRVVSNDPPSGYLRVVTRPNVIVANVTAYDEEEFVTLSVRLDGELVFYDNISTGIPRTLEFPADPGEHALEVELFDRFGASRDATREVSVPRNEGPKILLDRSISNRTLELNVTVVDDQGTVRLSVYVDSSLAFSDEVASNASVLVSLAVSEGEHVILVEASDPYNATSRISRKIYVDLNDPPRLEASVSADGLTLRVSAEVLDDDPEVELAIYINGTLALSKIVPTNSSVELSARLSYGLNIIEVAAEDPGGLSDSKEFEVDAPFKPRLFLSVRTNSTGVLISLFVVDYDDAVVQLSVVIDGSLSFARPIATFDEFSFFAELPKGEHVLDVSATDKDGLSDEFESAVYVADEVPNIDLVSYEYDDDAFSLRIKLLVEDDDGVVYLHVYASKGLILSLATAPFKTIVVSVKVVPSDVVRLVAADPEGHECSVNISPSVGSRGIPGALIRLIAFLAGIAALAEVVRVRKGLEIFNSGRPKA